MNMYAHECSSIHYQHTCNYVHVVAICILHMIGNDWTYQLLVMYNGLYMYNSSNWHGRPLHFGQLQFSLPSGYLWIFQEQNYFVLILTNCLNNRICFCITLLNCITNFQNEQLNLGLKIGDFGPFYLEHNKWETSYNVHVSWICLQAKHHQMSVAAFTCKQKFSNVGR